MVHFRPQEFIPQTTWARWHELGMRYINPKIPSIMDYLRECFAAPITINNWHVGGGHDGRCLRLPDDPFYKQYSDHAFGNAVDFTVAGIEAPEVQILFSLTRTT